MPMNNVDVSIITPSSRQSPKTHKYRPQYAELAVTMIAEMY